NSSIMGIREVVVSLASSTEFTIAIDEVLTHVKTGTIFFFLANALVVEFTDVWSGATSSSSLDLTLVNNHLQYFLKKIEVEETKAEVSQNAHRMFVSILVRPFALVTKFARFFDKERA
ncbi:hypothetical protein AWC38_SpisGene25475, partial [Stylophora pistillata]